MRKQESFHQGQVAFCGIETVWDDLDLFVDSAVGAHTHIKDLCTHHMFCVTNLIFFNPLF